MQVHFGVHSIKCFIATALSGVTFTGYSEVHRALAGSVLLTTGEHEYSRYGYLQLLQQRCADIIQPDITWLGGLTEVLSVCMHLCMRFVCTGTCMCVCMCTHVCVCVCVCVCMHAC